MDATPHQQQLWLEQFHQHKRAGLTAYQRQQWQTARVALLKAASFLLRLAGVAQGALREKRKQNALQLKAMALSIRAPEDPGSDAATSTFMRPTCTRVGFDQIAGLAGVKTALRTRMIYPFQYPDLAQRYGVRAGGGILFYGPPGTGKSLMAQAMANELQATFFLVKPSDILSKLVGEAEKNIAHLFAQARQQPRAVIFIDEIEALVPQRREDGAGVMQRIVPQILQEMQGVSSSSASSLLFAGATNTPWALDPAILRPGRFDELFYIGLPDKQARARIFQLQLQGKPLAADIDWRILAARSVGYSGADIAGICEQARLQAFLQAVTTEKSTPITLAKLITLMAQKPPSVTPAQLERFEQFRQQYPDQTAYQHKPS